MEVWTLAMTLVSPGRKRSKSWSFLARYYLLTRLADVDFIASGSWKDRAHCLDFPQERPTGSLLSWAEAPMRAEFLQKRLISAFFGFQWLNLAEILHLFKKYNNIGKVAVKRVSLTDYALWTLGSLDALVKKSSFPFHRSDYLCRESVDAAITHFFCRECCIYVLFCRECRDYALFDVEFYAEFLEEILRNTQNFGRNSAEKIGH